MPSLDLYKNKNKTTIWAECHSGNNTIFTLGEEGSGNFMVGGWSRKAMIMVGDVVIDLTGNKTLSQDIEAQDKVAAKLFKRTISAEKTGTAAILHLYIPDGQIPDWDEKVWNILAADVVTILGTGKDILLCCLGGHGRTGIAASILAYLIDPKTVGNSPIEWLREIYCEKVVENRKQVDYIHEVLDLPVAPASLEGSKVWYTPPSKSSSGSFKRDPNDGKHCPSCRKQYYCEETCKTDFHPQWGSGVVETSKTPNPIEMTDTEWAAMENGTLGEGLVSEPTWAEHLGFSW